jgi:hypothetical protein
MKSHPFPLSPVQTATEPIRAELIGSDTCTALGISATGNAPVLKLCRLLIETGHDPGSPLHVYRDATLALTVRSIGQGGALRVTTTATGKPIFNPVAEQDSEERRGSGSTHAIKWVGGW